MGNKQTLTIAAHESAVFDFQLGTILEPEGLPIFVNSARVFVELEYGGETSRFCFKYRTWAGKGPDEIAQFIRCDFNPSKAYIMNAGGIRLDVLPNSVGLTRSRLEAFEREGEEGAEEEEENSDQVS